MITPPKADTGSQAKASTQASFKEGRDAIPQALLCFRIAKVGSLNLLIICLNKTQIQTKRKPKIIFIFDIL
jgi:hypothetical protein